MFAKAFYKWAFLYLIIASIPVMISCGDSDGQGQSAQSTESRSDTGAVTFRIVVKDNHGSEGTVATRNVGHCHDMRWIEVTINDIDHVPFLFKRFECTTHQGTIKKVPADTYGSVTLRGIHIDSDVETTFYFGEYSSPFKVVLRV